MVLGLSVKHNICFLFLLKVGRFCLDMHQGSLQIIMLELVTSIYGSINYFNILTYVCKEVTGFKNHLKDSIDM